MARHNDFGFWGEEMAANYLVEHGYTICHRNWKSGHRDIDIVAYDDAELVFVEVKTRRDRKFCNPEDAVNEYKISNLINSAEDYINTFDIQCPTRFDIVTITGSENGDYYVEHIKDAFLP